MIRLRFGLHGEDPKTLRQTGSELGISAERARELEERGLRRLAGTAELEQLARSRLEMTIERPGSRGPGRRLPAAHAVSASSRTVSPAAATGISTGTITVGRSSGSNSRFIQSHSVFPVNPVQCQGTT